MGRLRNLVDFLCLARFQLDALGRPLGVVILVASAVGIAPARCSNWGFLGEIQCKTRLVYIKSPGWLGDLWNNMSPQCVPTSKTRLVYIKSPGWLGDLWNNMSPQCVPTSQKTSQIHLKRCTRRCGT